MIENEENKKIEDYLDEGGMLLNEVKMPESDDEFYKMMEAQEKKREQFFKQFEGARMLTFGQDISFRFEDILEKDLSYVKCYPNWSNEDWFKRWNNNKKITAIIDYPFDDIMAERLKHLSSLKEKDEKIERLIDGFKTLKKDISS